MPFEDLGEVHVDSLSGHSASYRMTGYFKLRANHGEIKVNFKGVAFGGHYGGHNVNVQISSQAKKKLIESGRFQDQGDIDDLLTEVQRRLLNGEMIVEFNKLKPEEQGSLGDLTS